MGPIRLGFIYWLVLMFAPEAAHAAPQQPVRGRPVYVKVCWHGRAYYLQQQQQGSPPVIINNPPATVQPNIVVQFDPAVGQALNRLADVHQQMLAIQYAQLALQKAPQYVAQPIPIPSIPGQPVVVAPAPSPDPLQPLLIRIPPAPIVVPSQPAPIVIPPAPPNVVIPPPPQPIAIPVQPGGSVAPPGTILVPAPPGTITVPGAPPPIGVPAPPGMQPIGPMPARWSQPRVVYVQRYTTAPR